MIVENKNKHEVGETVKFLTFALQEKAVIAN
jgi:hypothetical protein